MVLDSVASNNVWFSAKRALLLFPCTWSIPYYRYAILSILIWFKTIKPRAYVASSLEALVLKHRHWWHDVISWLKLHSCNHMLDIWGYLSCYDILFTICRSATRWASIGVANKRATCFLIYIEMRRYLRPERMSFNLQYNPRNMHTVFALLCFVVVIHWLIFPYPSGLLYWHCGNLTIAPVPAKQPRWIRINTSCEFIMNDCITTTKQSTTKPCAYFLGYTVSMECVNTWSKLTTQIDNT